jgi:hypothetical protein
LARKGKRHKDIKLGPGRASISKRVERERKSGIVEYKECQRNKRWKVEKVKVSDDQTGFCFIKRYTLSMYFYG